MVTCLFTGQYITKGYDMITDFIQLLVGSAASCWLDGGITPPTIYSLASLFQEQPQPIVLSYLRKVVQGYVAVAASGSSSLSVLAPRHSQLRKVAQRQVVVVAKAEGI